MKVIVFIATWLLVACGSDPQALDQKTATTGTPSESRGDDFPAPNEVDGSAPFVTSNETPDGGSPRAALNDAGPLVANPSDGGTTPSETPSSDGGVTSNDGGTLPAPACGPGESQCDGDTVLTCVEGKWKASGTCEFGCDGGQCNTCEVGSTKCDGSDVLVCSGSSWDASATCPYLCLEGVCVAKACEPNVVDCSAGRQGMKCNELGTSSSPVGSCASSCPTNFADCDGSPSNGCETDLRNPNNCGGCGTTCNAQGATSFCGGGNTCGFYCNPSQADCDQAANNGCEVNTNSNPNHCGGCGITCNGTNGTATCSNSTCGILCGGGFGDCNRSVSDGCETKLDSMNNCGGCGVTCNAATQICQAGVCSNIACAQGTGNCDGKASNGCETSTTTVNNCGGCGVTCNAPANMDAACNGTCQFTCKPGYADCDNNLANGCEINLKVDFFNCGTCGHSCSNTGGAGSCSAGSCAVVCNANSGNCDGNADNGCEVNLNDTSNCGSCGNVCNPGVNEQASCSTLTCSTSCQPLWGNCDGNSANGCELDLSNDPNNCGACGHSCNGESCTNGQCEFDSKKVWVGAESTSNTTQQNIVGVETDASNIYLGAYSITTVGTTKTYNGWIYQMDKDGGNLITLAWGNWVPQLGIQVQDGYVYWLSLIVSPRKIRVNKTPVGGGSTTVLAEVSAGTVYSSYNLVISKNYVYWLADESGNMTATLLRVPLGGGLYQTVWQGTEKALELSRANYMEVGVKQPLIFIKTLGATVNGSPTYNIYQVNFDANEKFISAGPTVQGAKNVRWLVGYAWYGSTTGSGNYLYNASGQNPVQVNMASSVSFYTNSSEMNVVATTQDVTGTDSNFSVFGAMSGQHTKLSGRRITNESLFSVFIDQTDFYMKQYVSSYDPAKGSTYRYELSRITHN